MKRIFVLLIVLVLVLTGCSLGSKGSDDGEKASKTKEEEAEGEKAEKKEKSLKVDKNLKDKELVKSIFNNPENVEPPKSYKMSMKIIFGGMEIKTKTVKYKDNYKTERNDGEDTYISIVRDDGYVYSYKKGEKQGKKYKDVDDGLDGPDGMVDFEIEEDESFEDDDFSDILSARIETLNGEEVLYMEMKDEDEGEGLNAITKVWYSLLSKMPLKMVSEVDGEILSEMIVTEITVNKNYSKEVQVPKNIDFVCEGGE